MLAVNIIADFKKYNSAHVEFPGMKIKEKVHQKRSQKKWFLTKKITSRFV